MYNFLDPKLLPKVSCESPATDNYEASNLLSPNEAIRARGYLAYTVIKPPVSLNFEFLCPVNINCIYLNTTVGTQKCTGIEIFVKTTTSPTYTSIGKAIYDKSGITFCDSKKYSRHKTPFCYSETTDELCFFKSDTFKLFAEACGLKIVIFRTHKSVPCLGGVKVFGEPAKICSEVTVQTIEKMLGLVPQKLQLTPINNQQVIPDDFKDDLTYDIMAIPMTLPSGKTIDRETLEKHNENEKSFGRKPCDPFTGLKFTETRKPNAHNPIFFGVKRTLGSNNLKKYNNKRMKNSTNCEECRRNLQEEILYILPCQHLYCKPCLLSLTTFECKNCQTSFVKSEVQRYFV